MTGTPLVAVPKYGKLGEGFSAVEQQKANEDPGRPWTRPAGGWISDLCSLQKFVMLCPFCLAKFNPRKNGYEVWRAETSSTGKCDGCRQMSTYLRGFISEQYHQDLGDWQRHPRRGRWARR